MLFLAGREVLSSWFQNLGSSAARREAEEDSELNTQSGDVAVVLQVFVKHKDIPIVKTNKWALSYSLLITPTICFFCALHFIGLPNTITHILWQITFGSAFTVALATDLAKAFMLVIPFRVTFTGRVVKWLIISWGPNFIIPICSLIQLVL
ncbi:Vomeronasal type-2 receptor 116 [Microtus ochrogaster]|uniref:Vomeronasal type-2 receptor 116 n=1 Tax=Microtus ochrogaster TaxID=79684 RepID=A0A8J6FZ04_MICOH|nr:Vomeronasal type-2 receptor 116 [Microtus ochrogaster]